MYSTYDASQLKPSAQEPQTKPDQFYPGHKPHSKHQAWKTAHSRHEVDPSHPRPGSNLYSCRFLEVDLKHRDVLLIRIVRRLILIDPENIVCTVIPSSILDVPGKWCFIELLENLVSILRRVKGIFDDVTEATHSQVVGVASSERHRCDRCL